MTFEDPIWLYLTPLVALTIAALIGYGLRRRELLLSRFAAKRLLEELTEKADAKRSLIKGALVVTGLAAITISLARPQYGVEWSERKARGLDIVFVLDSSKSMLATDLRPTRLARAKLAILDLVERLESDRIGLVAFAGQAFLQTPPTLDYSAFRESLEAVDPDVMTRGGSDLGRALQEAAKAFPVENNYKVVVLLTDGEDLQGGAVEAVKQAGDNGIKVYAIGIGTPEGEYLRIKSESGTEEFVRDQSGQPVRSQLDEQTLQEIARITGGSYSRLSNESLDALHRSVIATLPRSERESEMQEVRIERFQWVLSVACLLIVLDILIRSRKRTQRVLSLVIFFVVGFSSTPNLQAQESVLSDVPSDEIVPLELPEPKDPDLIEDTPPQKAASELYNEGHALLADSDFESARLRFEEAMLASDADLVLQRDALYNSAHSIYQLGEAAFQSQDFQTTVELWKEAEASFRSANEIDPKDKEALDNADLVEARRKALEEFLKQQQEQEQQSEDNQDQEQEGSDDSEEQQDSGESGEQDDGSEGEDSDQSEGQSEEQQEQSESDSERSEDGEDEQSESGSENESEQSEGSDQEQQSNSQNQEEPQENQEQQSGQQSEEDTTTDEESQPLPEQGDESEEQGEEASTPQVGESTEDESEAAGASGAPTAAQAIEGMTEQEARALLDSLMNSEQLLPFIEQGEPRSRQMQDW